MGLEMKQKARGTRARVLGCVAIMCPSRVAMTFGTGGARTLDSRSVDFASVSMKFPSA